VQLGLSRGQVPAHIITGACSGAVLCTGSGWVRLLGEGVSSAARRAEVREDEEEVQAMMG
jgi:hypothetical protein